MSRRHLIFGLAFAVAMSLAGCAATPTGRPTPTATAPSTTTPAPPSRPPQLLDGDCALLLTSDEVSEATGVTHESYEEFDFRYTVLTRLGGGLSCSFEDPDGVRTAWVTAFPAALVTAEEATTCVPGVHCFFTRIVGDYRVDGYVTHPTVAVEMVDALVAVAAPRLVGAAAPVWRPDGSWSTDLTYADLAALDVSELAPGAAGPFGPDGGGYQPASIPAVRSATGFQSMYWESDAGFVAVHIVPAGGWMFDDVEGLVPAEVPGATAAGWVPPDGEVGAVGTPGSSPLLVTDSVNLLRIETSGEPDAVIRLAQDVVTLLGSRA